MDNLTLQIQIDKLVKDLKDLTEEVYKNNFSAQQDFNKASNFTTRLSIPNYQTLPATCNINELVGVNGKLYIASKTNTWTLVGTQS